MKDYLIMVELALHVLIHGQPSISRLNTIPLLL